MSDTVALLVAAGRGRRMSGDIPKQYLDLCGRPVLRHTLEAFCRHPDVGGVRVVIHRDDEADFLATADGLNVGTPIIGGETRQESVRLGLEALSGDGPERVLIHDGARPLVSKEIIDRVLDALRNADGVIPALDVPDTLKRVKDTAVLETVPREGIVRAQTPQGFRFPKILAAHRDTSGQELTDDAAVAEACGLSVVTVPGEEANLKITNDEDLRRAADLLQPAASGVRMGTGFDVHRFGRGDRVRLGGIDIAHERGLSGHSDADVALHALTDALLGALAEGDIGSHFPPSDPQWRGVDSGQFLQHAVELLHKRGGQLLHADLTLICESPKIGPHRDAMRARIAELLGVSADRVSVKATTTEGLGFTGRAEGIATQAAVTVEVPVA